VDKSKREVNRREFLELGAGAAGLVLIAGVGCSDSNSEEDTGRKNVLVTYFSQTGNTEKIARAISEEASQANETELKKLEDVSPDDVARYDFIYIGSPLHDYNLAAPVKEFLDSIQTGADQKIAGFITHCAPTYSDQELDRITEPIKTACQENGMEYKGCFNCQGELIEALHDFIKVELDLSDEEFEELIEQMTGRPNEDDVVNAKAFAKEVLA
jgi:flavodoxin I